MKQFLTTLFLFCCLTSFAQQFKSQYGKPLVVLVVTDPWLMVIGSDVPCFALYEKGQIIYRKVVNKRYQYFEVKYDSIRVRSIMKSLDLDDGVSRLGESTEASDRAEQPANILLLNFDTLQQIGVYGNLRDPESDARSKTPKSFLTVFDNILKFDDPAAKPWVPDTVEVMASKYDLSPETPLAWNKEWSDLHSKTTVQRSDELYSIYLDKKYFADFIKLLRGLKTRQAVQINGEKYALSYRFPFPNMD
ncbi:hypothetical protein [Flavihumibacter petaseus]|uniref:Uncharacterized protein n=1 Tax=Flavihumibacter petaseus NBRC 106054 TaxID=1220578 RepID=A0A0E9MZ62_9BACT|nr:hypothetical protein [Flavihumibacter petaseus]GAO42676.1 hypothetical protein FPE01S_01_16910 [Flavihumibacter petaseus NBRC 106054]